jgi:hypothetical protein
VTPEQIRQYRLPTAPPKATDNRAFAGNMIDRSDYGEIYWRTFGKSVGREACRQGWERWQAIWRSGMDMLVLHPTGSPPPAARNDDRWIVARNGPLRFLSRASHDHFLQLPDMWLGVADTFKALGPNPRSAARAFVHNSLVDGMIMHPTVGPLIAGAIAWLFASSEVNELARNCRLIGYDISFVPGPPDKARMFNFRAIIGTHGDLDSAFGVAGSMPLPGWRPPPH